MLQCTKCHSAPARTGQRWCRACHAAYEKERRGSTRPPGRPQVTPEQFWAKMKVLGPDACWLWQASGDRYGQTTIWIDGKQVHTSAHRKAWLLTYGAIPPGREVCHTCDVPKCCNPKHLFLGTAKDNAADRDVKVRNRFKKPALPEADVQAIRAAPSYRGVVNELAKRYHVSRQYVSDIRSGRRRA